MKYGYEAGLALLIAAGLMDGCASNGPPPPELGDRLPAGIFLEPEDRAAPPAGETMRPVYDKGLSVTKAAEGFSPKLYDDVAHFCTIGYGHLIKKAPCNGSEPFQFRTGLTEPQGADLLRTDMGSAQRSVGGMSRGELTNGQYAALCDFAFNVGPQKLKTSTLLKAVNAHQYDRVPSQFLRWVIANGKAQPGLKNRREQEIALFFDGQPVPKAAPPENEDLSPIDIREGEQ